MLNYVMMSNVAKVFSVAPIGFEGQVIEVESDSKKGLPSLQIVGLGNKAIDEAKERVRSAMVNSLLEYPNTRLTINLAPAELPKDGTHYDLPIAIALLVSSGQVQQHTIDKSVFAGELALDGSLRPVKGILTMIETARNKGFASIFIPTANQEQARLIHGIDIICLSNLKSLFLHLKNEKNIQPITTNNTPIVTQSSSAPTLDDIYGQEQAKRALVIAAAGHHNILLSGTPGAGKTLLAKTLPSLLPELSLEEQLAATKLHSLTNDNFEEIITNRPFRSPHHTSSRTALIGGGPRPKPGEISLAHLGVLFLDELPEYPRSILESLRQPLEDKLISISRANSRAVYPADFMLVATMNPCPCGYYGDTEKECSCSATQIAMYQKRLSGPLLDRIDLHIHVPRVSTASLLEPDKKTKIQHSNEKLKINTARCAQLNRYKSSLKYNGNITAQEIKRHLALSDDVKSLLDLATKKLQLSARSYFKIIKVARTIADIDESDDIKASHISEAIQYRQFA